MAMCSFFILLVLNLVNISFCDNSFDPEDIHHSVDNSKLGQALHSRFLFYDINPGEGFNLRRDVYLRMANLVKILNEVEPWTLVVPPWKRLYHWKSGVTYEEKGIPWSMFFDLESLNLHVPVIEFDAFLKMSSDPVINEVYYLQNYKEGWSNGKYEEKMDFRECNERTPFYQDTDKKWRWSFWGYGSDVKIDNFVCLSIQSEYSGLKDFLTKEVPGRAVLLMRAEQVHHGKYSEWSVEWWTARRSVAFANHLKKIANQYREKILDSNDVKDKTEHIVDWRAVQRIEGAAFGGPYIAVHLRRGDFLYARKEHVPTLKYAASQIAEELLKNNLTTVFIATDAPDQEFKELKKYLKCFSVKRFKPDQNTLDKYKDGGVAIIDQLICSHARFFIGSYSSTFSFRIQEEREILGFNSLTTFNRLCSEKEEKCEQPTKWKIKYPRTSGK